MSLINDALKKAQKQRTGDTPSLTAMPSVGGESASRIARRGKPAGFNTLLTWISLGVVALAVVIVGVVILLRPSAPAPVVPPPVAKAAPITPAPQPVQPAPALVTAPPTTTTALVPPAPTPTAPTPVVLPAATPPVAAAPVPASATIVLAPAPEPAKPAAPAAPRKLENRAINYIDTIRVAGIRASGTDSKVLMNDRVYRIGDLVEAEMGLRLAGITTNSLTFEDEKGGRYTRNF